MIAGSGTAKLETAPGHATRCVESPFTEEFQATKSRLSADGVPDREAWEQLEAFNLGRLWLASKGIERRGEELLPVGPDRQLTEGMFMAGEAIVLRDRKLTIAQLHESLSTGGAALLSTLPSGQESAQDPQLSAEEPATSAPLDIAIVGLSGVFAGSPDLAAFWATMLSGKDAVTEVDPARWDPATYYDQPTANGIQTPSKWGGFLDDIPFDPLQYGIPPASLGAIEPAQLLALEIARRAMVDAGFSGERLGGAHRSRVSVVFGAEAGSDLSNANLLQTILPGYLKEIPEELSAQWPRLSEDSFPGMLSNVIAGRIANRLDLGGSNYSVDAACASSLAALDIACKDLVLGTADAVLCGAVDLHNTIHDYLLFASVTALSPTGRSRAFDAGSDGIALGEGAGALVLKRLTDAERDGDRIYAVIRGVGSSSVGRSLGLTAPRPEGQRSALERAYRNARISPVQVGLVEAHGTGTVVGDRTELSMLTKVLTEAGAAPGSTAIGSVKSQIGHTKCAAGIASLIKASLAIHRGVKPPTLHITNPSLAWDREQSPFVFHREATPWNSPLAERVAGISGFGFGGTNFHVVLSGHAGGKTVPARHNLDEWPAELFLFHGEATDAIRAVKELGAVVSLGEDNSRPWRLRDLTAGHARAVAESAHRPVTIAIVARDIDELTVLLARAAQGESDPDAGLFTGKQASTEPGGLAYLFPGQGSQRPGMLRDLFVAFPDLADLLELGKPWQSVMHPRTAFDAETEALQRAEITDTRAAQPVLGLSALALGRILERSGVRPDAAAGHSYGELPALAAAGAYDAEQLIALSVARAEAVTEAITATGGDPGKMAAASASAKRIEAVLSQAGLAGTVTLANLNAPEQTVLSGPSEPLDTAVDALKAAGLSVKTFPVACAFHSPVIGSATELFAQSLEDLLPSPAALRIPVWGNRNAAHYPEDDPSVLRQELTAQLTSPVRFVEQIESMYAAGLQTFIEVGPGKVLSKLVATTLGERPHTVIPLAPGSTGNLHELLGGLAKLAVSGVSVDTDWLYRGRRLTQSNSSAIPTVPGWKVSGATIRTRVGQVVPGALTPAQRLQEVPTMHQQTPSGAQPQTERDALVAEFLRTIREMIAAQRDMLLGYLGTNTETPQFHAAAPAAPLKQHSRRSAHRRPQARRAAPS